MSTLTEIEAAIDGLSQTEREQLLVYLAERLKSKGRPTPPPRDFSAEQIAAWIQEDEKALRRFREGK